MFLDPNSLKFRSGFKYSTLRIQNKIINDKWSFFLSRPVHFTVFYNSYIQAPGEASTPTENLFIFPCYGVTVLSCLYPDPNSQYGSGSADQLEFGSNPHPHHWFRYSCTVRDHHASPDPPPSRELPCTNYLLMFFYLPLPVFCLPPPPLPRPGVFPVWWWGGGGGRGEYFLHVWTKPPATTPYSVHRAHRTPKSPPIKLQQNYKWPERKRMLCYTVERKGTVTCRHHSREKVDGWGRGKDKRHHKTWFFTEIYGICV